MPVKHLRSQGHDVMGYCYNPNIHPYTENQKRLETVKQWADTIDLKLIVHDEYDPESWLRNVAFREELRCRLCFLGRLDRAASVAAKGGFDAFSTTLLYSTMQKHELLKQSGHDAGLRRGAKFWYHDFRPMWKQGVQLSLKLGLYRQQYCGCIFSERDRYLGVPKKSRKSKKSTMERLLK
jgi:predicted adenine nucleotide alpha hydrolase (AANH) superfamily ATPase